LLHLFAVTVQHIARDALDKGVAVLQADHPVRGGGGKDLALALAHVDHHTGAVAQLVAVLRRVLAIDRRGGEGEIGVTGVEIGVEIAVVFFFLPGEGHGDDGQVLRGTVFAGGIGQAIAEGIDDTVALEAGDVGLGTEQVTIVKVGALERPVFRAIDGEAAARPGLEAAHFHIDAPGAADAPGLLRRPIDGLRLPDTGEQVLLLGVIAHRVFGGRAALVADQGVALAACLPDQVAGKAREVTARLDVIVDGRAFVAGVVFVVADYNDGLVVLEQVGVASQVILGIVVQSVTVALGPACEQGVEHGPAGGGIVFRIATRVGIFQVWIARRGTHRILLGEYNPGCAATYPDQAARPRAQGAEFG
jgi:hypothetical protein